MMRPKKFCLAVLTVLIAVTCAALMMSEAENSSGYVWDFGESRPRGGASFILFSALGDVKISDTDEWAKMREHVYGAINAGDYVSVGRYSDAIALCNELPSENIFVLGIKANAQEMSGDKNGAVETYRRLIDGYENMRATINNSYADESDKSRWFSEIVSDYKHAAAVTAEVADGNDAFRYAEYCKGRNLIDHNTDVTVETDYLLGARERDDFKRYGELKKLCLELEEYAVGKGDESLTQNATDARLTPGGEYKITVGRTAPAPSSTSVNDNAVLSGMHISSRVKSYLRWVMLSTATARRQMREAVW